MVWGVDGGTLRARPGGAAMTVGGIGSRATTVAHWGDEGDTLVTYHETVVVMLKGDTVTLNSGGYRTATTKRRMNETSARFHLGYRVFADAGHWYVQTWQQARVPFVDGMTFKRKPTHAG